MLKYYYMDLLFRQGNMYKEVAFWMKYGRPYASVKNCTISVDEYEERTRFDYYHNTNNRTEKVVES